MIPRSSTSLTSALLILTLATTPAFAQNRAVSIRSSMASEATAAALDDSHRSRRPMFWSGVALGVAGVTTAVLGVTVARVEDSSTGNAPSGAYRSCVAQKQDPIYASSSCEALKAKNRPLLWSGVALGAVGAALVIGSTQTSAQVSAGAVRLLHTIRF